MASQPEAPDSAPENASPPRPKRTKKSPAKQAASSAGPRKIPGNLPYLTASGTLKRVLDKIIEASRPEKFSADYLENVLKMTGGAARATIPILKKMHFLSSDGVPTDLYGKFRTDTGRPGAALQGLKNAFSEVFRKSEYAYSADEGKLRDIIVEITGLKGNDPVTVAIKGTFNVIKSFIPSNFNPAQVAVDADDGEPASPAIEVVGGRASDNRSVGLIYNINVVLPATSDLKILNAIFRSLKENMLP